MELRRLNRRVKKASEAGPSAPAPPPGTPAELRWVSRASSGWERVFTLPGVNRSEAEELLHRRAEVPSLMHPEAGSPRCVSTDCYPPRE